MFILIFSLVANDNALTLSIKAMFAGKIKVC
jgi:hypothetical protein